MLGRIVDELARREGPRILAGLIGRLGGDFDLAEDALQDAYERALASWPAGGIPDRPAAWLTTVAQRCAIDRLRRSRRNVDDADAILEQLSAETPEPIDDAGWPDDRLRLLFTCCHPAIAAPAQMALALRTLCGLSTREIARAFLEAEATDGPASRARQEEDRRGAHSLCRTRARRASGPSRRSACDDLSSLQRGLFGDRRRLAGAARLERRGDPPGAPARAALARASPKRSACSR